VVIADLRLAGGGFGRCAADGEGGCRAGPVRRFGLGQGGADGEFVGSGGIPACGKGKHLVGLAAGLRGDGFTQFQGAGLPALIRTGVDEQGADAVCIGKVAGGKRGLRQHRANLAFGRKHKKQDAFRGGVGLDAVYGGDVRVHVALLSGWGNLFFRLPEIA